MCEEGVGHAFWGHLLVRMGRGPNLCNYDPVTYEQLPENVERFVEGL